MKRIDLLTKYAPTVPCANIRAHSATKNILIFEKHEGFLSSCWGSSELLCFFTSILNSPTAKKRSYKLL